MFIISIHYTAPLEEMDKHIPDHIKFLDHYYEKNIFMASGRKVPRTGGVILAAAESIGEIEKIILDDPFHKLEMAEYTITEFTASKRIRPRNYILFDCWSFLKFCGYRSVMFL